MGEFQLSYISLWGRVFLKVNALSRLWANKSTNLSISYIKCFVTTIICLYGKMSYRLKAEKDFDNKS